MARILVAGVGAIGSSVAARLSAAGESVGLLARGARLDQLRRDGLLVDFPDGPVTVRLPASDQPDLGVQDIVFIAVKAHGLGALLPTLRPLIGPDTRVVPLVNGIPWWYFQGAGGPFDGASVTAVDPHGALRTAIASANLVGCVVYITANLHPTGRVSVLGGQRLVMGGILPSNTSGTAEATPARLSALASMLTGAGLGTTVTAHIRDELWTKVALNLATNPLSVVTGATLIEMFTDPALLPRVCAVLEETVHVAAGHGATPTMTYEQMIATGRRAGAFETSMLQDYNAGRPLELDAIGHGVLELAGMVGAAMPITSLIVDLCAHRGTQRMPHAAAARAAISATAAQASAPEFSSGDPRS